MGRIYNFSCEKCNYTKELNLGAGRLSIKESAMTELLEKEDLERWQEIKSSGEVAFFSWELVPVYCEECKALDAVVKVNITNDKPEKIQIGCRCKICKKKQESINLSLEFSCPECGKILRIGPVGFWD